MNPYDIVRYPIATEKAIRLMEAENKVMFIVDKNSSKKEIKEAIELLFKVKIVRVNITILPDGKKKAYLKLAKETPAIDIATQLGLM